MRMSLTFFGFSLIGHRFYVNVVNVFGFSLSGERFSANVIDVIINLNTSSNKIIMAGNPRVRLGS